MASIIGVRVRQLRMERGLSQLALAKRIGRSERWFVDLESGRIDPRVGDLLELSRALGINVSDLLRQSRAGTEILRIAIAVVMDGAHVLLVRCRDESGVSGWQFPAGVVKPGANAAAVAVRETLTETGIHCSVRRQLGSRIHPITHVFCEYFLCDYLAGTAENHDVAENLSVAWVEWTKLTEFIPRERVFRPVLDAVAS